MYSGSEDQSIIRWNTNTAKPSTLFKGTNGPIRDLLVNGDDLYLANGSTVRVQKISSGDLKFNLIGHTEVVVTIVLDAVSGILYSGAADCRVGLWRSGALLGFFQPAAPDIVKALRLHNGMLYAAIASEVLVWDVASVTRTVGVQIARPNSPPALHDAFGFAGGDDFNSADSGGSASNFGNFGFIGAQSNEAFSDPSLMALTMSFPAPPVERAASVVSPTLARRGPQPASVISPTLARRATPQQQQAAVASPRPQHRNNPLPALPPVPRPQPPAPSAAMPPTGHDRALPALPPDDDDNDAPAPAVDVSASLSPRVPRPLPRGAPGDAAAMEQRSPPLSPEFTSPVGSPRIEQARPLPAVATFSPNTLRRPLPTQQPPPQQSHASMSPPPLERPAQRSPAAAAAAAAQPNAPPPLPRPAAHRVAQQQRSLRQQQQQQTSELWDL